MIEHDRDYFQRREKAERRLAAMSREPSVRFVHETLADEYQLKAELVGDQIVPLRSLRDQLSL